MKHRRWLAGPLIVMALLVTAGVAYAAGVGSVNNGTDSAAEGDYSTVGGGINNSASGFASVVAGGGGVTGDDLAGGHIASGTHSTVSGGRMNTAAGDYSVVAGGFENVARGFESAVLGGGSNIASGDAAAVISGHENFALGSRSLVAGGSGARAGHDDTFVWFADSERDGEFVVRAYGGVRFIVGGTNRSRDGEREINLLDMVNYIESLEARIEALENGSSPPSQPSPEPDPSGGAINTTLEAEDAQISAPFGVFEDEGASGGAYIAATSTSPTSSPRREASYDFSVPDDGTYYLWARLYGPDESSDAMYIGIDGSWSRVYPESTGEYLWTRVGVSRRHPNEYEFSLDEGGHEINVGHAELRTRLDALFVTDDANAKP